MIDVKLLHHLGDALAACGTRKLGETVVGILRDGEMRKECKLLEDVSDVAFGDGKILVFVGSKENAFADFNSAGVRSG